MQEDQTVRDVFLQMGVVFVIEESLQAIGDLVGLLCGRGQKVGTWLASKGVFDVSRCVGGDSGKSRL